MRPQSAGMGHAATATIIAEPAPAMVGWLTGKIKDGLPFDWAVRHSRIWLPWKQACGKPGIHHDGR